MSDSSHSNPDQGSPWVRLFFMIVCSFLYGISRIVVAAVAVMQFFWLLLSGESNGKLRELGQSLGTYTYQIVLFLTFATEKRPYPIDRDWPTGPP